MISNMVRDLFATVVAIVFSLIYMQGDARNAVVADSLSRLPLPAASVFARDGDLIGLSDVSGRLPSVAEKCYPITVSYLGFDDMVKRHFVAVGFPAGFFGIQHVVRTGCHFLNQFSGRADPPERFYFSHDE